MGTVTYHKQPGIHKTRGNVPLAGTSHVYTVSDLLWPDAVEGWIKQQLTGSVLHVCCGKSRLGDVRLDLYEADVDIKGDATRLPFSDNSFDCVLADPPYSGVLQFNHDVLNELHRIARQRIIFQHWFSPVDKRGLFKKNHVFELTAAAIIPYMPEKENDSFRLATKTPNGYAIVEDDPSSDKTFYLENLVYWSPRSYFGRVQLISVMSRISDETTNVLGHG